MKPLNLFTAGRECSRKSSASTPSPLSWNGDPMSELKAEVSVMHLPEVRELIHAFNERVKELAAERDKYLTAWDSVVQERCKLQMENDELQADACRYRGCLDWMRSMIDPKSIYAEKIREVLNP